VMASGGYPSKYPTGLPITGLDAGGQIKDATVYHAGTRAQDGKYYTAGGRGLGVTATGKNLDEALERAYRGVAQISFENAHFRRDIGRR